ncbi:MAG: hypothetical protein AAGH15_03170, partial [Myxococcota bacterium]
MRICVCLAMALVLGCPEKREPRPGQPVAREAAPRLRVRPLTPSMGAERASAERSRAALTLTREMRDAARE